MPASRTTSVGADGTIGEPGIESFAPMPDSRQRFCRAGGFPSYHSAMRVRGERLRWEFHAHRHRARLPLVALRHRGLLPADVVLAAYPKSGNTWLAFLLTEVIHDRPADWESSAECLPAVGRHAGAPAPLAGGGRTLRTHERRRPEYHRAIYLVRHPADVARSYHRWLRWRGMDPGPFERFFPRFLTRPVDGYGPWGRHVESWLTPGRPTLLLRYEDLRAEPLTWVGQVLRFLDLPVDEARIERALEANSLDRMRAKEGAVRETLFRGRTDAGFVGAGGTSGGADRLSDEQFALLQRLAGPALELAGYSADRAAPILPRPRVPKRVFQSGSPLR
jgi:Sulfotransferase domain